MFKCENSRRGSFELSLGVLGTAKRNKESVLIVSSEMILEAGWGVDNMLEELRLQNPLGIKW
jgi:hypothetical protein